MFVFEGIHPRVEEATGSIWGTINQKSSVSLEKENTQSLIMDTECVKFVNSWELAPNSKSLWESRGEKNGEAVTCLYSFACKSVMSQQHSWSSTEGSIPGASSSV